VEDKCYERRRTFHTKISENLVTSFKYSVFFVFLTHLCNVVNVYCNTRNTKLFAGELLSGGHVLRETTSRGLSGLAQADLS